MGKEDPGCYTVHIHMLWFIFRPPLIVLGPCPYTMNSLNSIEPFEIVWVIKWVEPMLAPPRPGPSVTSYHTDGDKLNLILA